MLFKITESIKRTRFIQQSSNSWIIVFLLILYQSLDLSAAAATEVELFARTSNAYPWDTSNFDQVCQIEFGSDYRLADWNEVVSFVSSHSLADFYSMSSMTTYRSNGWVTRGGAHLYSSNRHYFIERHDGAVPSGWLVHDSIGSNDIDLGSWFNSRPALCSTSHPPPTVDHFLCYKVKATKFSSLQVGLADQFDLLETMRTFDVRKAMRLCTPADKDGGGITNPDIHLKGYQIKPAKTEPPQARHERQTVTVINQFGEITLQTSREDSLLVPSLKDLEAIPPAPDPASHNVDHYKCYKVRRVVGFEPRQVMVSDQFNEEPKLFDIKKPSTLCNPVQKTILPDGAPEPIKNPDAHLLCYQIKTRPKTKIKGVNVTDQFGSETINITGEKELCAPSEKIVMEQ